METVKNFGRLVCLVLCIDAILIFSLARMGHPWNVFEVCKTRYKNHQLTNFPQYSTLNPSCLPSDSPTGAEVCRKPYPALRKSDRSDPLERLLHFSRPLSIFSRLEFRFRSHVGLHNQIWEFCQTLPTFTFLSNAGIEPSTNGQHTLQDFISALENGSGVRK